MSVATRYGFLKRTLRKVFFIMLSLISIWTFGQFQNNRFGEEESSHALNHGWQTEGNAPETVYNFQDDDDGPPNPADPVPVDQYLPLLFLLATLLAFLQGGRGNRLRGGGKA